MRIEIIRSPNTVWVNSSDGVCIGRFDKRFGIDIHQGIDDVLASKPQCLYCTHAPAGIVEWMTFIDKMKEFHGVDIPADTLTFS